SLLYVNADSVAEAVLERLQVSSNIRLVVCDLSASPYVDLAGSRVLHRLHDELASRGIMLRIVGARGGVRVRLDADGIAEKTSGVVRIVTLDSLLGGGSLCFVANCRCRLLVPAGRASGICSFRRNGRVLPHSSVTNRRRPCGQR